MREEVKEVKDNFNGSPLLDVLPTLKAAGKNVYTFDAYSEFLDELTSDDTCLKGIMAQNTFGMARKAVEAALALHLTSKASDVSALSQQRQVIAQ